MADLKYSIDIDTSTSIAKLKQLKREIASTERNFKGLGKATKGVGDAKTISGVNNLTTALKGLGAAYAIAKAVEFGTAIIDSARKMELYDNQLRIITKSSADLARVQGLLIQTAIKTRTSYGDTVELFSKLRISTDAMGKSEADVIKVTENLSKALQVAGADTATSTAVIRQFGQAMASGTVRGDEFRSLAEGLGPALAIMGKETGITVGKLRQMSRSGELTAEVMFDMIQNSTALNATFNNMKPTITSLETAFTDSFTRMKVELGEVTGLTDAYKTALISLGRVFDRFAETESALVNQSPEQLFNNVITGSVHASAALDELRTRFKAQSMSEEEYQNRKAGKNWLSNSIPDWAEAQHEARQYIKQLELMNFREHEAAEARQETIDAYEENRKGLVELTKGFEEYIALGEKYEKMEFGTPLEKLTAKRDAAITTLSKLTELQKISNESGYNSDSIVDYTDSIKAAGEAVDDFNRRIDDMNAKGKSHKKSIEDIAAKYKTKIKLMKELDAALIQINKELAAGTLTNREYAYALDDINEMYDRLNDKSIKAADTLREFKDVMFELNQASKLEFSTFDMSEIDKKVVMSSNAIAEQANDAVEALEKLKTSANANDISKMQDEIIRKANEAMGDQERAIRKNYEYQRTFTYGWHKAFQSYSDDASNAAKHAADIFKTASQSMEDSIVNFVKTGKFEFKDLAATILEQLLRIQIQKTITGIMGGNAGGGVLSNMFSGFFATGGMIPAGRYGVVGESGPELVEGPATVTPASKLGGGNVTYHINAVDASSFKQLVAKDPQFLYAITEQGRKRTTGGR